MDIINKFLKLKCQVELPITEPHLLRASVSQAVKLIDEIENDFVKFDAQSVYEYNLVIDKLEQQLSTITTRNLAIEALKQELNTKSEIEKELCSTVSKQEKTINELRAKLRAAHDDKVELKRLKQLQPDKLKSKLDRYKRENKTKSIKQNKTKINTIEQTELVSQSGVRYSFSVQTTNRQFQLNSHLQLAKVDWHYILCSSLAINLVVPCTEWGTAAIPSCEDLWNNWHPKIPTRMHEIFLQRLHTTNPNLAQRIEWAKETLLDELNLCEDDINILRKANIHTIFEVVVREPEAFKEQCNKASGKTQYDLSNRVMTECTKAIQQWELDNKFNRMNEIS